MTPPLTEVEIRQRVRNHLSRRLAQPRTRAFEELGIEGGSSRVDVVIVGKSIDAFEIKSDFDNFNRLRNQIHAYNRVFDTVTLVTGPTHVIPAHLLMPSWWGIACVARSEKSRLTYKVLRKASKNLLQNPRSLATLLWKEEALLTLAAYDSLPPKSHRATRAELQDRLATELSLNSLRASVAQHLLNRQPPTARPPSRPDDGSLHLGASYSDFRCLV